MSQDGRRWRVFVVDDEAIVAATLALILKNEEFNVSAFELPLEALQVARQLPPDLLITDVVMPVLSGIELAIQMRELCPNCKVLLSSGQAATTDLLADARSRGYEFKLLPKPLYPEDLIREARTMLNT